MNCVFASGSALFLLVGLCACAKSEESISSHSFRIYEENGVTIAETTGEPKYERELFEYEKLIEIRADTTNEEAILYIPSDYVVDNSGYIHVVDSWNHRIAVFDQQGKYLRSIGKEGDGPGEFRRPSSIYLIDGNLQIPIPRQHRTTIYETDGTLVEVVTYRSFRRENTFLSMRVAPNGTLVVRHVIEDRGERYIERNSGFCIMTAEEDTIAIIESPMVVTSERIGSRTTAIRYRQAPSAFYSPEHGIYITTGYPPEVMVYSITGTLVRIIRIDLPDEPVTASDKEAVRNSLNRLIFEANEQIKNGLEEQSSADILEWRRDNLPFADIKAHWSRCWIDAYGYIWLLKADAFTEEYRMNKPQEFYVLTPEGEYLGNTRTMPISSGKPGRGLYQAMVTDPETGELIPTIYRIRSAVEGFIYP